MNREAALKMVRAAFIDRKGPDYYWSTCWKNDGLLAYMVCSHKDFNFSLNLHFQDNATDRVPFALKFNHILDLRTGQAVQMMPDETEFENQMLEIIKQPDSGRTRVRMSQIA